MKAFCCALTGKVIFTLLISIALIPSPFSLYAVEKQNNKSQLQGKLPAKEGYKTYSATFFGLKRGNSIAPATMILYDKGGLEIKIEREHLAASQGKYSTTNYVFEGDWQFTINRTRPYHYISHFKGLYLFDTYIIGLLTLKEYIEEQRLTQEIPLTYSFQI